MLKTTELNTNKKQPRTLQMSTSSSVQKSVDLMNFSNLSKSN